MYKVVEWSEDLDLTEFYLEAERRGFANNSSQKVMVDCFRNEREWKVWILLQDDKAIGSVAAHSFDDVMGEGSYRILTRTCTFAEARPTSGLVTAKRLVAEHQNLTDQFLLPKCIEWAGKNVYATSNHSGYASQRLVHTLYFPTLEKLGITKRTNEIFYRGIEQTVWAIDTDAFFNNLSKYPRWN